MKRTNAIIAAVIVIVIIVAAVGAFALMNPGSSPSSSNQGGASDTVRPSGPEGTVNSAVIDTVAMNDTNASDISELQEEFNASSNSSELPDVLARVAVTNNRTDNITIICGNFTAMLDDGSSVQALNRADLSVSFNTTVFIVLGFVTNGVNITSINYSADNISFTPIWTKAALKTLPPVVFKNAPTTTLNATENLTFTALDAWQISKGRYSPMALRFNNQSIVLALIAGTNNNTTAVNLKASDFWLDLGNGSWVQGDDGLNNNVPKSLAVNTTVPFLLGFRGVDNTTPTAIYYWPGTGSQGDRISLSLNQTPEDGTFVVLWKVWDYIPMAGMFNASSNANGQAHPIVVQLLVVGNDTSSVSLDGIRAWTLRHGELTGIPIQAMDQNLSDGKGKMVTVMFTLPKGDDITLLQYEKDGSNRFVWLRPMMPAV